jgi:hypothetical protein
VQLLRAADIEALVDIRRFPNSRHNPDVEMSAITTWAQEAGLVYRCDPRLGGRRRLPAGSDPEDTWWRVKQFAAYAAYTRTAPFGEALTELVVQSERQRTAMMCSEAVWWRCHRRIVADVAGAACASTRWAPDSGRGIWFVPRWRQALFFEEVQHSGANSARDLRPPGMPRLSRANRRPGGAQAMALEVGARHRHRR